MITRRLLSVALNAALFTGAAALVGCNQQPSSTSASAPAGPSTAAAIAPAPEVAQAAPAYTPPTADQLYQMVAPIALFPDKLVAQVLAGSTYPDQITAADQFLEQNQSLQGAALQDAVDPQSWDPSIKGLTVFPKVLDQMAQNIPWTTALGTTYANDPTDVLNAIQVMRQRASKHGTLRSSAKLRVVDQPVAAVDSSYAAPRPDDVYDQVAYSGPDVVPPPQQTIEILPADDDTVYVPQYDPQTVYGDEVQAYPTYSYDEPGYSRGDLVTTGAIAFGAGIVIATLFEHHHHDRPSYGWNSWDMQWRGNRDRDDHDHGGRDNRDRWQRPAVVHNNTVYETRSTTINNHYVTNNINNSVNNSNNHNNGNTYNRDAYNRSGAAPANAGGEHPAIASPRANEQPAQLAHVNIPSQQPVSRPNFNGALSKGQPERFAHPGIPVASHPGVPATPLPHADIHQPHVNVTVAAAPDQNRPGMPPHASPAMQSRQSRELTGSHETSRFPSQHVETAAQPERNHTPENRPVAQAPSHAATSLREHAPPTQQQMPRERQAPVQSTRASPVQHAPFERPMAAPQQNEMQRRVPRSVQEIPREQPRQQIAPRPAVTQRQSEAPRGNDKHEKKDDKGH